MQVLALLHGLTGVPVCPADCREIELQHSVLSAQLSAQAAAIQQEREALMSQRVNTDMLASLSEQVGMQETAPQPAETETYS